MTQSDIGIVEKLLRKDQPFGWSGPEGDEWCEYANPDGPEAAAIITEMVEALEDIADPMRALRREAVASGNKLSGAAYQIANDPFFIKSIAKTTLAKVRSK